MWLCCRPIKGCVCSTFPSSFRWSSGCSFLRSLMSSRFLTGFLSSFVGCVGACGACTWSSRRSGCYCLFARASGKSGRTNARVTTESIHARAAIFTCSRHAVRIALFPAKSVRARTVEVSDEILKNEFRNKTQIRF